MIRSYMCIIPPYHFLQELFYTHTHMPVCKMEFRPVSKLYCQATTGTQVSGSSKVNMMQPVMGDRKEMEPSHFFPWRHPCRIENLVGFMADVCHAPSRSRTHIPVVHRCWAPIPLQCQASIAKPGTKAIEIKSTTPCVTLQITYQL